VDQEPDRADQLGAVGDHESVATGPVSPGGERQGGLVVPTTWNKKKERPSVLDLERLMRQHRERIRAFLSEWLGTEENAA
jgi:hypothetical protein